MISAPGLPLICQNPFIWALVLVDRFSNIPTFSISHPFGIFLHFLGDVLSLPLPFLSTTLFIHTQLLSDSREKPAACLPSHAEVPRTGRGWGTLWEASGREHGAHGLVGVPALLPPGFVTSVSCLAAIFFTPRVCQLRVMVLSSAPRAVTAQELLAGKGLARRHRWVC